MKIVEKPDLSDPETWKTDKPLVVDVQCFATNAFDDSKTIYNACAHYGQATGKTQPLPPGFYTVVVTKVK